MTSMVTQRERAGVWTVARRSPTPRSATAAALVAKVEAETQKIALASLPTHVTQAREQNIHQITKQTPLMTLQY